MLIYYINMAGRTDRRAFMEQQFARLGMQATRIEAVTPGDLGEQERAEIRRLEHGDKETGGFCCTLSHLAAMRSLLETAWPFALILEDDAVLSASLPHFLRAYEAARPPGDLLRIETSLRRVRLKPLGRVGAYDLCGIFSWEAGRAAYLVTRRGAETILSSTEVRLMPHDQAMFDPYEPLAKRLTVRQLRPALCIQSQFLEEQGMPLLPSDLDRSDARPMVQSPWRRFTHAFRRDVLIGAQKAWHQYVGGAKKQRVAFKAD